MKSFWVTIHGNSMSPLIKHGDEVFIEDARCNDIIPGEILYFKDRASGELTLHRLIKLPFKTKGDYSFSCETNEAEVFIGVAKKIKRENWTCALPMRGSRWTMSFLLLSILNGRKFFRKPGRAMMIILTFVFWRTSRETIQHHNEARSSSGL